MAHALLIEDDSAVLEQLEGFVQSYGFSTSTASTLNAGRRLIENELPDITLVDLMLPDGRGTSLLDDTSLPYPLRTVLMTGKSSVKAAIDALRGGFVDYLTKPLDTDRLGDLLERVSAAAATGQDNANVELIGESKAMHKVRSLIERVAPTDLTTLISGETGTGKELVARAVHGSSLRASAPFVAVNCAAISPSLAESELFGHERGSFTGAHQRRAGLFELASGGTLFLDEINAMPQELQAKLLRVLDASRFRRVGGSQELSVDTRIIAASNQDLEAQIERGEFRSDLYYRLGSFVIDLEPLRQREGDSLRLAEHFLRALNDRHGTRKIFSGAAVDVICDARWPGNVRQLKNFVEQSFLLADRELKPHRAPATNGGDARTSGDEITIKVGMGIREAERLLIEATLEQNNGSKKATAETLGISLKTLYNRLTVYRAEDRSKDP